MIEEMTGKFINYKYEDIFLNPNKQLKLKEFSQVFEIKEDLNYGK